MRIAFLSILVLALLLFLSCSSDNKTNIANMTEAEFNEIYLRDSAKAMKDPMFNLDKDSVKKVYGDRFNELRTIIKKHDPVGLVSIGASNDEYEPEVKSIIVQLEGKLSEQQIHDLVYQEFLRWFGDESTVGPKEAYKGLAKDIYSWTQKSTIPERH